MKTFLLLLFCILSLSPIQTANAVQLSVTEVEGTACMGDTRSKKQTEQAALVDAKRRAVEFVSTHIKSETEVKDLQLVKDQISSYANAAVKVIQELEKKWYKDVLSGDCYLVKIKAEVIPDSSVAPSKSPDSEGAGKGNRRNLQHGCLLQSLNMSSIASSTCVDIHLILKAGTITAEANFELHSYHSLRGFFTTGPTTAWTKASMTENIVSCTVRGLR